MDSLKKLFGPTKGEEVEKKIQSEISKESSKPFTVSVMGQTGVGKSSLVNALFGTNLKVDPVQPCTKEIEKKTFKNKSGHELWFYDLPGIGETEDLNTQYLKDYLEKLRESDVVIWAIHIDSRSITLDVSSFESILSKVKQEKKNELLKKITFVMTKADLITEDPWVLMQPDESNGRFQPGIKGNKNEEIFTRKSEYYKKALLPSNTGISLEEENFIPCSSKFKYNLDKIMKIILKKLQVQSSIRIDHFSDENTLQEINIMEAKKYRNIIFFDKNGKVWDLVEMIGDASDE
jgi:predicted GTPase